MRSRHFVRCLAVLTFACLAGIIAAADPTKSESPKEEVLPAPRPALEGAAPVLPPSILCGPASPIDLASALELAGVQNPEILLARQRVLESVALRQLAAAQLLPTINLGTNFNSHIGPLQRANGSILDVNRSALYLGLGANAVGAGTVNIPGIVWSGNVSRTFYTTLVSRQIVQARDVGSLAVRNDVLLRVAQAYLELMRAQGRRVVALRTREEARELARVTANYARTGQGRQADADRAATELEQRNADLLRAEGEVLIVSARLCQLLHLDPSLRLHAMDGWVVPAPLVPDPIPLPELIAIAMTQRPELRERQALIRAALLQLKDARCLPFSPNLILGYSAGTFGGGSNHVAEGILQADGTVLRQPRFDSFAGRQDFDAVVFWSLRNLGVGNVAQVRLAGSNLRSEQLREVATLDRVRAEVAIAQAATHARFAQIGTAERAVESGQRAFKEDLLRTRHREGLPIEVLDSLRLLARSRYAYLDAIIDYNRAQFELYVALGQPPAHCLARPVPPELVASPPEACAPTVPE